MHNSRRSLGLCVYLCVCHLPSQHPFYINSISLSLGYQSIAEKLLTWSWEGARERERCNIHIQYTYSKSIVWATGSKKQEEYTIKNFEDSVRQFRCLRFRLHCTCMLCVCVCGQSRLSKITFSVRHLSAHNRKFNSSKSIEHFRFIKLMRYKVIHDGTHTQLSPLPQMKFKKKKIIIKCVIHNMNKSKWTKTKKKSTRLMSWHQAFSFSSNFSTDRSYYVILQQANMNQRNASTLGAKTCKIDIVVHKVQMARQSGLPMCKRWTTKMNRLTKIYL